MGRAGEQVARLEGGLKQRRAVLADWNECSHEWEVSKRDWDLGGERSDVICTKCQCPGERDDVTGEVFWPAT